MLLYGILIVTNRFLPPQLSSFFPYKFSIVLYPQIDQYGLQWIANFLSVLTILSVMTQVYLSKPNQKSARDRDSRAKGQNWSIWEVNISSPDPKGMNSKWVFFIHIILIIYLFMSISLLEEKKCNSILGFHDERVWVFMVSKLFKYIFAFDHVCYKLLYDCPLLGYMNITLNMFAIMFFLFDN